MRNKNNIYFIVVLLIILNMGLVMYSISEIREVSNKLDNEIVGLEVQQKETRGMLNEISSCLANSPGLNQSTRIDIETEDYSKIINDSIKSVVTVLTETGQGTGFFVNNNYIVTNYHVIENSEGIEVIDHKGMDFEAELIGKDIDLDIAIIKIDESHHPLVLSNSSEIRIGERVIAIGNPLGLSFSVTEGIVSGVQRQGPLSEKPVYIQTDVALNPGNSGGPLINMQGQVIGVNNFKVSGAEGIGFALKSNYIKEAINNIETKEMKMIFID